MRLPTIPLAVFAVTWGASEALAQSDRARIEAQGNCVLAAKKEQSAAKLALQLYRFPPTIEDTLSERRLEEQYCLKEARCMGGEATTSTADVQRADVFSNCLKNEALEKYRAVPR